MPGESKGGSTAGGGYDSSQGFRFQQFGIEEVEEPKIE